jgi:hypothetical protein
MFVTLRNIYAPEMSAGEIERLVAELKALAPQLPAVRDAWIAPVSPVAVINAGQIVWRMTFATESQALLAPASSLWRERIAPLLNGTEILGLGYRITQSWMRRRGPGIWRALLLRVMDHAEPALVRRLAETTLLLGKNVPEIRSWALSPVTYSEGAKAFSYVWEQEFDSVADLTGPYMTSPTHWGVVDAFFDADCPEYIVDPFLVQVVGAIDQSIMERVGAPSPAAS